MSKEEILAKRIIRFPEDPEQPYNEDAMTDGKIKKNVYAAMDEYSEIVACEFAEWVEDNNYTKGKGDKGWYQYFQHVEDLPCGAALSYPVYTFLTIEEVFSLFIQSKQ